jgi:hypothetical protein
MKLQNSNDKSQINFNNQFLNFKQNKIRIFKIWNLMFGIYLIFDTWFLRFVNKISNNE